MFCEVILCTLNITGKQLTFLIKKIPYLQKVSCSKTIIFIIINLYAFCVILQIKFV